VSWAWTTNGTDWVGDGGSAHGLIITNAYGGYWGSGGVGSFSGFALETNGGGTIDLSWADGVGSGSERVDFDGPTIIPFSEYVFNAWYSGSVTEKLYNQDGSIFVASVPEPSTWAMMLFGFGFLGYAGYRGRRSPVAAPL
jgi:hypothetical protein